METLVRDARYAEGAVWSPEGFLLFSDTVTDQIKKWTPGKGLSDYLSLPGGAAGSAYDEEGRLYICEFHARRVTRTGKNGKTDVLAARFEGKRLNAPSDIVVRRDGNVYFTDPAFGNQQDSRELDFYGVYRIKTNGELEAIARWKTRPNGIALSPNGRLLYVADSDARLIRVYDLALQRLGVERTCVRRQARGRALEASAQTRREMFTPRRKRYSSTRPKERS